MTLPTDRLAPLTRTDKVRLVGEILADYFIARWQMRRSDVREIVRHMRAERSGAVHVDFLLARRLGRAVARTLSFLPTDNRCLARSLVLDRMLARRSLQSVLIVGARSEPDFASHAWIEHDGTPVLPPGSESFQRLIEL